MLEIDSHLGLVDHLEEDVFGHVRLEGPHGGIRAAQLVGRRAPGAVSEILLALLKSPGVAVCIVQCNSMIELARHAADGRLVADVRRAEPAGSQPAEVIAELGDYRRLTHASCLHPGCHAAGRAAIDAQVGLDHLRRIERW